MFKLSSIFKPAIDSSLSNKTDITHRLLESAQSDVSAVLQSLHTEAGGLNEEESRNRRKQ